MLCCDLCYYNNSLLRVVKSKDVTPPPPPAFMCITITCLLEERWSNMIMEVCIRPLSPYITDHLICLDADICIDLFLLVLRSELFTSVHPLDPLSSGLNQIAKTYLNALFTVRQKKKKENENENEKRKKEKICCPQVKWNSQMVSRSVGLFIYLFSFP